MTRDDFGGVLVEDRDEFGGVAVAAGGDRDEFGGVAVDAAPDELGIGQEVRGVGRAVKRGVAAAERGLDALRLNEAARLPESAGARRRFVNARLAEEAVAVDGLTPAQAAERFDWRTRAAKNIAAQTQRIESLPPAPDLAGMEDNFWSTLARNPVEVIATTVAESLPQAVPGMVASLAGGPAAVAGGAANSFGVEYANTLLESAGEQGFDLRDPDRVRAFFSTPAALEQARNKSVKRGLPVAAFDAATAGLAGRFLKPALGQGVRPVAVASGKELLAQAGGGMAGEAGGQLASEGRITSVPDIVLEGIAELGTAPAEVFGNVRRERAARPAVLPERFAAVSTAVAPAVEDNELPGVDASSRVVDEFGGELMEPPGNPYLEAIAEPVQTPALPAETLAADAASPGGPAETVPAARAAETPPAASAAPSGLTPAPTETAAPEGTAAAQPASASTGSSAPEVGLNEPNLASSQAPPAAPRKPRAFRYREAIGDILDDIEAQGGLMSKGEARHRKLLGPEKNGPEYDDVPTLKQPTHNFIYGNGRGGKGTMTPDRMAKALQEQHPGKYDGLSVPEMWAAIEAASNGRVATATKMRLAREQGIAAGRTEDRQQKAFDQLTSLAKGGPEEVNVDELSVGGEVVIDGDTFKVAAIDPESGDVVLQDGPRFGRRVVEAGKVLYVEQVSEGAGEQVGKGAGEPIFSGPESVADQNARLAGEQARRAQQEQQTKLADLAAKPLIGSVGDIGQGDLLGGGDLFSAKAELLDSVGQLVESLTPKKGITEGPGVTESAQRVLNALGKLAAAAFRNGLRSAAEWARSLQLELSPALQHAWDRAVGGLPPTAEVPPEVLADLPNLPVRQFTRQVDASPEVADAVKEAVSNRLYTRKPNEATAAFAARIITGVGGPEQAAAVFADHANALGGAERTMLGQLIVKQLSAAGKHEAAARFLDDVLLPYSTDAAQTLQAFAAFAQLSPEGALIYAKRQFGKAGRKVRENIQPVLDTVADAFGNINRQGIEAAANDPKVQGAAGELVTDAVVADGTKPGSPVQRAITVESADRMKRRILLYRGIDSPRTMLARLTGRDGYWKTLVKGQTRSLTTALEKALGLKPTDQLVTGSVSQLAGDLGRILRQQMEALLAKQQQPVTPRTAKSQLVTLLANAERLSEVWAGVRAALEAEGKTDPNVLRVLDATVDVWSKPLLADVAREYLKTADVSLAELVRNHYVETTDGRPSPTLTAKIMDWLGVNEAEAQPLARAFDQVLREEAEKVRKGMRARVAAVKRDPRWKRVLKSGLAGPEGMSDLDLDAAIAQGIREQRVKLGALVREHHTTVDATGKTLAEKVAASAGVDAATAARFAELLRKRFADLTQVAKADALRRIEQTVAVPRTVKQNWQRLLELSNLGALDRESAWNAVAEKLKLPKWTPAIAKEVTRLAGEASKAPEGIVRQRRVIELHNYLARQVGVPLGDLALAFWYANILSGPTTHAVNLLGNLQNLAANIVLSARHPADLVAQLAGLGRGFKQGGLDAADILRTGIVTRTGGLKLAPSKALELARLPGRADGLLTPWRLVGRALAASDAVFFRGGQELRAVLLARQLARSEGLSGPALERRVQEVLGRSQGQRFRAVRQALREGVKGLEFKRRVDDIQQQMRPEGLNESARDFAFRVTFNQKPYGALGAIAQGINWTGAQPWGLPVRLVVPFTNIVANVANESLNYFPPVGAARGLWGHWKGELEGKPITDANALGDQWGKVALGTVLLGSLFAAAEAGLDDDDPWFAISGGGPRVKGRTDQLKAGGWIPYSIKLGNRYVSYGNSPVAIPLSALGNYFDALKYRELGKTDAFNRLAYAVGNFGKVIVEQSFLDGLARVLGALERDNPKGGDKLAAALGRTASSLVVPNALRQLDQVFDPTVYDARTAEAALVASVPFVRRTGQPALNVWGAPVQRGILKRFGSETVPDPLLSLLAKRGLWVSAPSQSETKTLRGELMTEAEFYGFVKARGQHLREMLARPRINQSLRAGTPEVAEAVFDQVQRAATLKAKAAVAGR